MSTHCPLAHPRYDRSRQSWIINYDAVQTGAGVLNGLVANTRDELRSVSVCEKFNSSIIAVLQAL